VTGVQTCALPICFKKLLLYRMFTKLYQKSENLAVHSCEVADYYMAIPKLLSLTPLQCISNVPQNKHIFFP
jgi:hypothetical protein